MDIPQNWDKTAHSEWMEGMHNEAIQTVVAAINLNPLPLPKFLAMQLAFYLAQDNNWGGAASVLTKVCNVYPDEFEALLNLGICLGRAGNSDGAISTLKEVLHRNPGVSVAWDGLAAAYSKCNRYAEAKEAGEQSLILKNKSVDNLIPGWSPPAELPSQFVNARKKQNIISFSLWGDNPRYLRGAIQNAMSAPDVYPGWRCRFYVDRSVPEDALTALNDLGAELVYESETRNLNNRTRLVRRFWVANDQGVGYFVVRDCDSVISIREANAVNSWIDSNTWFHVMRDWWTHTDLILAGMWGGVAGVLPDLKNIFIEYRSKQLETQNWDQWFLRDRVWGLIRDYCLVHDRCFRALGSLPFPGDIQGESVHVGQDEFAVRSNLQETALAEWIDRYPCLRVTSPNKSVSYSPVVNGGVNKMSEKNSKWNRVSECRHGTMIYNCHDKYIGRSLELYGEFSEGEAALFRQIVKKGQVIVEAGANIGVHTLLLAKLTGPKGKVYAFEPQRLVYQLLAGNMAINSINNVYCFQKAVGNAPGTLLVPTLDCEQENNWGGLSLGLWQQGEPVEVITLDSLGLSDCNFLKIDVEGMELQVLQGAADLITKHHPILYVENDRKEKSAELISYLDTLGYELYWHRPPLYQANNHLGNNQNVFSGIVSINMLCVHKSTASKITGLQRVDPSI